jgi:uncharacterized membrane protein
LKKTVKGIFLTGFAVIIPIGLTLYILFFIISMIDNWLMFLPDKYHPDTLLRFHVPGLGIIVTVILIFICGLVTKSYFGRRIFNLWENFVEKIPVVRSLYQPIKQIVDGVISDKKKSFKKVVLVEFPRKGMYTIGFITGHPPFEVQEKTGKPCFGVFVPTTPNPTSGYFIMVPEDGVISMDMSVEEAFTLIISMGIVTPQERLGN